MSTDWSTPGNGNYRGAPGDHGPTGGGPGNGMSPIMVITIVGVAISLVLLGVITALLISRNSDGDIADAPTSTSAAMATTVAPTITVADTTPVVPTVATVPPNLDPTTLPAGLYCRDLKSKGYSYNAAVAYWTHEGLPDRMDADRNGIPCETVYSWSDIVARYPSANQQIVVTPRSGLARGLFCKDLKAMGLDVYQAIDYYVTEGYPERMDADGNGVPCETVYANAEAAWYGDY